LQTGSALRKIAKSLAQRFLKLNVISTIVGFIFLIRNKNLKQSCRRVVPKETNYTAFNRPTCFVRAKFIWTAETLQTSALCNAY
jgi:hypothetical protein